MYNCLQWCNTAKMWLFPKHHRSRGIKSTVWIVFLCPTGEITLLEFMEGAQKDEWVMDLLKLDVNATGWVIQNCGRLESATWCIWRPTEWCYLHTWGLKVCLCLHVHLPATWSWSTVNCFIAAVQRGWLVQQSNRHCFVSVVRASYQTYFSKCQNWKNIALSFRQTPCHFTGQYPKTGEKKKKRKNRTKRKETCAMTLVNHTLFQDIKQHLST